MSTLVTTNLKHGGAASPNIVLNSDGTFNLGDSKVVTPAGSAPSYTCRAWVNFNGTTNTGGFCTVRASGNVTSVADNGTGDYIITFTTAMPDANYAVAGFAKIGTTSTSTKGVSAATADIYSTTQVQVRTTSGSSFGDAEGVGIAIFR